MIVTSKTPSDWRALANFRARLKRAGVQVEAARNPTRVRGPGRPAPHYIAPNLWTYRGWRIEIDEVLSGHWGFLLTPSPPVAARLKQIPWDPLPHYGAGVSPDSPAALQRGTFAVDALERYAEIYFSAGESAATEYARAIDGVRDAIQQVTEYGDPLTRAAVARKLEERRRDDYPAAVAFGSLPLAERLSLIDDMLELAHTHEDYFPNPRRAALSWNPSRVPNVYTPKGQLRPRPSFVSGSPLSPTQLWSYRGHHIEIAQRSKPPHGWTAMIAFPAGGIGSTTPSPDPMAALQHAVFRIDRAEVLVDRDDLECADHAVMRAIEYAGQHGVPFDRARVAREIEGLHTGPSDEIEMKRCFDALPLAERLELIDEYLALAHTHGGHIPAWNVTGRSMSHSPY